ncbi:RcpC/CpaB family pilus assembly protein [Streptomyces solaniscabiei]|uniref:RcpC/CpaB family pilus assembly protein n=2 Tax=Streptomyces solaniscabiei TaxID=2683255 RepID=UPI001CE287B3|nr:RcpC/CpaB family pilus assembly protein [Streptomyces solaniscabiei]
MSRSAVPFPQPLGADAPPTCEVPHFAPVRVRGGRHQLHRLVRHRRRAVAAGLAVTAAALVAAGPHPGTGAQDGGRARGHPVSDRGRERPAARPVAAPVRIADAATVRLLAPGDRVDVVASDEGAGGGASVIARGARVLKVPEPDAGMPGDGAPEAGVPGAGALVVLSVPPATAHRLVGAGARARLAVTLS